ncbi:Uncharacterised protein [BD1-7 clade bacterium]|nr:Uncharacterised protein [BD1-7 clade bacterium]
MTANNDNSQQNIEDLQLKYVLNKLVYVNSATHAYSEIQIDSHMALFGANNKGKTASLAGLKLSLFPETSFTHCSKKFKFIGKDGAYSKEESYSFYFPDYRSYIVTEITNPQGTFCMILHKATSEWGYGRFFVPLPYTGIKHWLWDKENNIHQQDLSFSTLAKKVKDAGGIHFSGTKEISKLIYDGYRGTPEQARYCILPLTDGASPPSIEAFKNLYQIAFDIGQSDKNTLPRAIATIIEMRRGRQEERLNTEIDDILSGYKELSGEKSKLTRLLNSQPDWDILAKSFKEYVQARNAVQPEVMSHLTEAEMKIEAGNERMEHLIGLVSLASAAENEARTAKNSTSKLVTETSVLFKDEKRRRDELGQLVEDGEMEYGAYGNQYTTEQACVEIQKWIEEEEACLVALQSEEKTELKAKEIIRLKNQDSEELSNIQKQLETNEPSWLEQLPTHTSDMLYSINKSFSTLPGSVSEEASRVAQQFSDLLSASDSGLLFDGHLMVNSNFSKYQAGISKEELQALAVKLQDEIQGYDKNIASLNRSLKNPEIRKIEIAEKRESIEEARKVIRLIKGLDSNRDAYQTSMARCTALENDLESHMKEKELAAAKYESARAEHSKLQAEKNTLIPEITSLQEWIKSITTLASYVEINTENTLTSNSETKPVILDSFNKERISASLESLFKVRNTAKNLTQRLLQEALPDEDSGYQIIESEEVLHALFQQLGVVYSGLDRRITLHEESISTHNTIIDNQIQELREAQATVENFVTALNKNVNRHPISNLAEVRLSLSMHPRFTQLMKDVDRYNFHDSELLDPGFYDRLISFCDDFFDGKSKSLSLEMIIDSIRYEYRLEGEEKFDTKSQSGGTTSTTTSLILSVLLRKISPEHITVGIPIVVDEIGTLDGNNKLAAIDTIAEQGFAIFCATPTPEPAIMEEIGRWVCIDKFNISKPVVNKCHTLILPECIETFASELVLS